MVDVRVWNIEIPCADATSVSRGFEEPLDGRQGFYVRRDGGRGREVFQENQLERGLGMVGAGFAQGADFARKGWRVGGVRADLDEEGLARSIDRMEIDLVALWGTQVVNLAAAALEFDEDGGFKRMAEVVAADTFINRYQAGIYRIGLARVDHALAFRSSEQGGGADHESVLEVGEEGMETVFRHRQTLGFQGIVEFLDAEWGGGISQQMALEPAKRHRIGDGVALDDVAQDGDIHIRLQQ